MGAGSGLEWLYRLLAEPRRLWKRYLVYKIRSLRLSLLKDALFGGERK